MAMTTSTEEQPEALESEEAGDAFSGKKKSKFQNFKKFFAKKKKSKDLPSLMEESQLRPSQACSDGGSAQAEAILLHPPTETEPNGSTGNQGLLHDSESAPETLCDVAGEAPLQENFPGKVKDFEQNPCLEPPLVMTTDKRMNDGDTVSEDDSLPGSLLELSTIHDILLSSTTLVASVGSPKHDSSLPAGSPVSPLGHALLVDFNSPASPLGCLDTSAARHRIAMNPRKQRGFAKKSHHLLVEQRLPEPDEEKGGPSEFLEEAASWRKVPEEQIPVVFSGRSAIQSTWISGAKQKQHGSQDEASAKGQKKREEAVAQTGKEEVKLTSASHLEQQVTLTGDSSSKKSVPHQNVRLLESKVLLKSAPLAAKEGPARILPQEGPRLEKDTRLPPILPLASCSSTEPPWLSLAKKKAKAWSEMPQTVQ